MKKEMSRKGKHREEKTMLDTMNFYQRVVFARKLYRRIQLKDNVATRLFLERIKKEAK